MSIKDDSYDVTHNHLACNLVARLITLSMSEPATTTLAGVRTAKLMLCILSHLLSGSNGGQYATKSVLFRTDRAGECVEK